MTQPGLLSPKTADGSALRSNMAPMQREVSFFSEPILISWALMGHDFPPKDIDTERL